MNQSLYLLKFHPILKEKIWGGEKIETILGKCFHPAPNCGESWEISDLEGDTSIVANGFLEENDLNELIEIYMYDFMGDEPYLKYGLGFPLLIKFIDAKDDLSVQVHPDDAFAQEHYQMNGKNELWYVMDADEGAGLYVGFKNKTTKMQFAEAVKNGTVDKLLNFYPVKEGEVFYIPAGTVHAIGKGVLLSEIQQSSDITLRVFDWNRVDEQGHFRELHVIEALEAIHFDDENECKIDYEEKSNGSCQIIRNDYFNINLIKLKEPLQKNYHTIDSFVIYICVAGEVHFLTEPHGERTIEILKKGEVLLKPACIESLDLVPIGDSKLLEVYVSVKN